MRGFSHVMACAILLLAGSQHAKANAFIVDQENIDDLGYTVSCGYPVATFLQEFVPERTALAAVDVVFSPGGSFPWDDGVSATLTIVDDERAPLVSTTAVVHPNNAFVAHFELPTPLYTLPGSIYGLLLEFPDGPMVLTVAVNEIDGSAVDTYPAGQKYSLCPGTPAGGTPGTDDLQFRTLVDPDLLGLLVSDLAAEPPSVAGVAIGLEPANGDMTGSSAETNELLLSWFRYRLGRAQEAVAVGELQTACWYLSRAEREVSGDTPWFAGQTAARLQWLLDLIQTDVGCTN